jgi:hypothetical protein
VGLPVDPAILDGQVKGPLDRPEDARADHHVDSGAVFLLARVVDVDLNRRRRAERLVVGRGKLLRGRFVLRGRGEQAPHRAVVALLPGLAEVPRRALGLGVGERAGQQPRRERHDREDCERCCAPSQA